MDALLAELKAALSPNTDRLPQQTRQQVFARHGDRVGQKVLRSMAENSAQSDQISLVQTGAGP